MKIVTFTVGLWMIGLGCMLTVPVQAQSTVIKSQQQVHPLLKWCPGAGLSVPPNTPCPGDPGDPGDASGPIGGSLDCGNDRGCYSQLTADIDVYDHSTTIMMQTIDMPNPSWVYLESDGRVFPSGGGAIAYIWIGVDGLMETNASVVGWSQTTNAQQHSYNCIGAIYLSSGIHIITLVAESLNANSFTIGADSNLSTLTNVAPTVKTASLGADTATLDFDTQGLTATSVLPTSPMVTVNISNISGSPVVALASARAYESGHSGDPLLTITMDGATLPNDAASWSDNDLYSGAETQAPFFSHAYITSATPTIHAISLSATELPYSSGINNVTYRVGASSTLIALQGMQISGSAALTADMHNVSNYVCVGSSQGWPGCPPTGSPVAIAQGDIVIPFGSDGVVLITGKTRIQAAASDVGGTAYLYLEIDGVQLGSIGIQQLHSPDSVSTRTLSSSFLTSGAHALSPGMHHVVLYGKVSGSFIHAAMTKDLPLVWFN